MENTPARPPLGAHVSVAGGLDRAFPRGEDLGCNAIQIFVKNANQWRAKPLDEAATTAFRDARTACSTIGPVVAHASYLINLAATAPAVRERSVAALSDEMLRCARLGVDGLVLHPGAHLGAGEECGVERAVAALDRALEPVFEEHPETATKLLLENTAGQGSCLGHRIEHLSAIRDGSKFTDRIGVCLDTCHAFAAGYALHEEAGYEEFWGEVEERLGLETVGAMHLNDSVRPFASRKDRHAHIGEGEMGITPFERLLNDERLVRVPMVIETETGEKSEGHR
ncbi:MAG TPA: deoxyribonuclease IV, partial [Thermoanaerobaculia bacterium]|nr:deoxyribonuclease IV [Thermoanaerobaculia bacterium]